VGTIRGRMIGYSVMFDGSEECVERALAISRFTRLELAVTPSYLEDANIIELVDPLAGEAEVVSFRVAGSPGGHLEKALIAADELGADMVSIVVGEPEWSGTDIDELFQLGASYSKYIVLEPRTGLLEPVAERLRDYIGGVFKLSLASEPHYSVDSYVEAALRYLGLLKVARLTNFTAEGRPVALTSREGRVNFFAVIGVLVRSGFDGVFMVDYEGAGLAPPLDQLRQEMSLLDQYLYSLVEKV